MEAGCMRSTGILPAGGLQQAMWYLLADETFQAWTAFKNLAIETNRSGLECSSLLHANASLEYVARPTCPAVRDAGLLGSTVLEILGMIFLANEYKGPMMIVRRCSCSAAICTPLDRNIAKGRLFSFLERCPRI
jgi:hypothetical protein